MDCATEQLLNACELVLYQCQQGRKDNLISWYFEAGSEAHLALIQAIDEARLTFGLTVSNRIPNVRDLNGVHVSSV